MNTVTREVGRRERKFFGKVPEKSEIYEDLVKIQKDSFKDFLNNKVMESIKRYMPIKIPVKTSGKKNKEFLIDFVDVKFEDPSFSESECRDKGLTYAGKAYLKVRITDSATGEMIEKDDIFLCNIPYMTNRGIFIINGAERVIVNQLVRSPGVYFIKEEETDTSKEMFIAHFLPIKGAWLEILYNPNPGKRFFKLE